MKKIVLLIGCLISIASFAQEINVPYKFPVKPGMSEWAKLNTSQKKDEVSNVPDQILKSLTTEALLLTCMDYPRLIDLFAANDMQKCFEFYSNHFNGLKELLNRSDLNKVLLYYYPKIDVSDYIFYGESNKPNFIQISFFELLLAQEKIIGNFNSSDQKEIKNQAIKNIEIRRQKHESIGRQITNALVLSRLINLKDSVVFDQAFTMPFKAFNSYGIVLDTTIVEKIITRSKQY